MNYSTNPITKYLCIISLFKRLIWFSSSHRITSPNFKLSRFFVSQSFRKSVRLPHRKFSLLSADEGSQDNKWVGYYKTNNFGQTLNPQGACEFAVPIIWLPSDLSGPIHLLSGNDEKTENRDVQFYMPRQSSGAHHHSSSSSVCSNQKEIASSRVLLIISQITNGLVRK